jgi:hypothetical protein
VEAPVSNEISATTGLLAGVMGMTDESSCLAQTDLKTIPNNIGGYGVVDAYAAVQAALALQ